MSGKVFTLHKSKLPHFRCNISENNQVIGGKVAPLQQQET